MNCIVMRMAEKGVGFWSTMLQKGVGIQARVGLSVSAFLEGQLNMDGDYVESVVRTIFINGSPVDDVDTAPVNDGDVLALAGAMPGLVGIAMGRQSPVGVFRGDISCAAGEVAEIGELGFVTVKAFNVVARTAGADILGHGIVIAAKDLVAYLNDREMSFNDMVQSIHVDTNEVSLKELCVFLTGKEGDVSFQLLLK